MKKNFRYLMLGIIIGALAVSVTAFADVIWDKIDVVRNEMNVYVNNEKLEADNFLYNNTTYVPIRAVAEALGKNVGFENGNAYIEEKYEVVFGGKELTFNDKYVVTEEEYNDYIKFYKAEDEGKTLTQEEIQNKAVKAIIEYNVIKDVAYKHGIILGSKFNEKYTNIISFLKLQHGEGEGLKKAFEESGFTEKMYQRYMQEEYLLSELATSKALMGTDEEVKLFYEQNPGMFNIDGVQAQHILIGTTDENNQPITDKATLDAIEAKVKDIHKRAVSGEDFNDLIIEFNEDPGMETNPEGYVFTKGEMVAEFEKAAYALADGEISAPVRTEYGWHIIKKIGTVKKLPLTPELHQQIAEELASIKLAKEIQEGMAAAVAKN